MLTAQDLRGGGVVYWGAGGWRADIGDGLVARDDDAALALEGVRDAASAGTEVLDAFLLTIDLSSGAPTPAHFREASRVTGPSFRDDFGRNPGAPHV